MRTRLRLQQNVESKDEIESLKDWFVRLLYDVLMSSSVAKAWYAA